MISSEEYKNLIKKQNNKNCQNLISNLATNVPALKDQNKIK